MAVVDLSGKAVVITGGARGLGAAAAPAVVDGGGSYGGWTAGPPKPAMSR
ncbi:hypothetical protein OV450_2058 [Actinobacteria bacterium OV450]|nr:hypothetical protein OV450_2058 [Actinobacteria bacterium OV450]